MSSGTGWYPQYDGQQMYWNGQEWTDRWVSGVGSVPRSDIPESTGTHKKDPPGWYPQPDGQQHRYWNGREWGATWLPGVGPLPLKYIQDSGDHPRNDANTEIVACPRCRLKYRVSKSQSGTALTCGGCGTSLSGSAGLPPVRTSTGEVGKPIGKGYQGIDRATMNALRNQAQGVAQGAMIKGLLWFVGGVGVSIVAYAATSPGDRYPVFWGAAIFGGYQFLRGLYYFSNPINLLDKDLVDGTQS